MTTSSWRDDEDRDFIEVVEDQAAERMEAALAMADRDTVNYPEGWRDAP